MTTTWDGAWLDSMYNNRALVPTFADFFQRWGAASSDVMRSGRRELDVRYGGGPNEHLDIYPAQQRFRIDPKLVEQGRKAARGRNVKAMIDADIAFHSAIYAASGNPLIEQSAHQHWRHLRRVMGAVLQSSRQREALWDEHEAIAKAIAAGDGERAARLIDDHSRQASETLAGRLSQVLDKTREGDKQ